MKSNLHVVAMLCATTVLLFAYCAKPTAENQTTPYAAEVTYGGYDSPVKWGEHLVKICGCNDCHTPKIMGPQGPEDDTTRLLSGHPADMPPADIDRKLLESKGIAATDMMTAWIGPWGISYTGNLTSDETGIGTWQESNFITAIREGKYKGISSGRSLLPPMPWQQYRNMTDDELKAIFAYLKSTKPVKNIVPAATPPVMAAK